MSENGNSAWSDYADVLGDLQKDTRVGDHDFMVSDVTTGKWSDLTAKGSDDPYFKVNGVLLTANQAKASIQWSPPPPASVVKAQMDSWEPGKRRAIAGSITLATQLAEHYGAKFETIKVGDVYRVKTIKTKVDDAGKGGFIRIVAFLPKDKIGQASKDAAQAAADIPF